MSRIKLTAAEVEKHLTAYIANCEKLIAKGQRPTSICLEGEAGIGKTSLVRQIAEQLGYKIHVENTSAIDDLGNLVGFPVKEFLMSDGTSVKWIPSEFAADAASKNLTFTGNSRMSYAQPDWLKEIGSDEKFILFLDDYTRALPMVMQACMTITEEYRYKSWELPKNAIVILSTNPDNGEYSVASLDLAQKTRMRYLEMVFDVTSWAQWAESKIDGRCINFVLNNPELFNRTKDGIGGNKDFNARSMTKFFNDIGQLPDFSSELGYVKIAGDGSVGQQFTELFITFVNNRLDQLPSPKDLIFKYSEEEAVKQLLSVCGDYKTQSGFNPATASILANRLANYIIYGEHDQWGKAQNEKAVKLILSNAFSDDLKVHMSRTFMSERARKMSTKYSQITLHPAIIKMMFPQS